MHVYPFFFTVARTGERLSIRLYNRDFQPPFSEVQQMLKKADLESHGYKKEVIVTAMKGLGSDFRDIEVSQHQSQGGPFLESPETFRAFLVHTCVTIPPVS